MATSPGAPTKTGFNLLEGAYERLGKTYPEGKDLDDEILLGKLILKDINVDITNPQFNNDQLDNYMVKRHDFIYKLNIPRKSTAKEILDKLKEREGDNFENFKTELFEKGWEDEFGGGGKSKKRKSKRKKRKKKTKRRKSRRKSKRKSR